MTDPQPIVASAGATFKRPWAFWLGVAAVTGGVGLHLPMYIGARHDGYMLVGMPFDIWMDIGMVFIAAGFGLVLYGLAPRFSKPSA